MVARQAAGILLTLLLSARADGIARPEIPAVPDAEISAPTIRLLHRITRRLEKLQNLAVTYRQLNDYTPPPKLVARFKRHAAHSNLTLNLGYKHFTCRFSFLRGRSLYERRILPGGPDLGLSRQISTYTPQRAESLVWQLRIPKTPLGVINDSAPLPNSIIDVALGLRPWRARHWLTPADVMKMRIARGGGASVLVVTRLHGPWIERWTFRIRPSLELVDFRDAVSPGDGEYVYVVSCSDFSRVQGVELPGRIAARFLLHGLCDEKIVLTNLHYMLGSKANTPASYLVTFPIGSAVLDARTGRSWRIESRPRKMSDLAIYRLLNRSDNGATGTPGGPPVGRAMKGGAPVRPGSTAVRPSSVAVPLGVAALPARTLRPARKWFWWTVLFLSMTGFAVVAGALIWRIRLWKR